MRNAINYCESPLKGIQSSSHSAFLVDEVENLAPFSFSDVTDIFKRKDKSNTSINESGSTSIGKTPGSNGIFSGILGVLGGLSTVLPQIGIGSKSRIAEANAIANANTQVYNDQTQLLIAEQNKEKDKERLYLIMGVGILLIIVVAGVLFSRK